MRYSFIVALIVKGAIVQFLEIQKFCQSHIEGEGNLVQGLYPGILGQATNDVIQRGLLTSLMIASLFVEQ